MDPLQDDPRIQYHLDEIQRLSTAAPPETSAEQWPPRQGLKYLGQLRAHALALAGGENDDAEIHEVARKLGSQTG